MIWIIMGIALIFFLWLLYGYSMNFFLKTENYTINSPRIAKSFKAVLLADLHSASFGKKNEKLIRMIDKESPDLIISWYSDGVTKAELTPVVFPAITICESTCTGVNISEVTCSPDE